MGRAIKHFPDVFAIVGDQMLWRDYDHLTAIVKVMSVDGGFGTFSLLHADRTEKMTGLMDLINMKISLIALKAFPTNFTAVPSSRHREFLRRSQTGKSKPPLNASLLRQ